MSPEVFTDAQINGPKNVMGYPDMISTHIFSEKPKSVFETIAPIAAPEVIGLLKLAEREGAYEKLSEKTRQRLEMHFLEGMSITKIADIQKVSKQAVSQSLRLTPESLYKKMTKDVFMRRTNIPFTEILRVYSAYRIESDAKKKGGE